MLRAFPILILSTLIFLIVTVAPAKAAMGVPGTCGTQCMALRTFYGIPAIPRPVYAYPYGPVPMQFYASPINYWPMMSPWYSPMVNPFLRGVSSEENSKKK